MTRDEYITLVMQTAAALLVAGEGNAVDVDDDLAQRAVHSAENVLKAACSSFQSAPHKDWVARCDRDE
jgi:hypothetical protein